MTLIHHVVTGSATRPVVFVHGFGCGLTDWDSQVAHLSSRFQAVAVDLRGHGSSPGPAAACSIERYGADVAELMRALALPPAVLVGHSLGCRVVMEAALQAPVHAAGVVLVDGSQFAPAMEATLQAAFGRPKGYETMVQDMFRDMFHAKADPAVAAAVAARVRRLPQEVGEKMLLDLLRYDVWRLPASLGCLRVPVMAIQTTYANEKRERKSLQIGQATPYLSMLRDVIPAVRIEIIEETGHFPQLEEPARTNALLDSFLASVFA
ncbi:alpha/beta fold hydrolase [Rhodopila sp.]|jgi:pimeloyl-ACP methyl ester carboxylesterase|uniref:alpha/beta fold hydrolase n=1 Tax=Rhodopila sp. TaxID=2480087 RepID=UPI002D1B0375|nr:alpha/beta hydrolase [Rhodopila sp.]HVZ10014.1 alpha/beta hydrolase [Rhodopila sp.]